MQATPAVLSVLQYRVALTAIPPITVRFAKMGIIYSMSPVMVPAQYVLMAV